tara:strand:+ start:8139 stop:8831 length:693 start_codon:yes stop_codon:yes gene_type:complete
MKIAVLGTGNVGQTLAEKLISMGHEVKMGTRDVSTTMERKSTDNYGSLAFREWYSKNEKVQLITFKEAVIQSEMVINALQGAIALSVIQSCNTSDFDNKIVIDISNPLDFSQGFPPSLLEGLNNTNSLGEEIQKELPKAKVVKTLNTMWCGLMVNPTMINNGSHQNYICGNDKEAKEEVLGLLLSFGWSKDNNMDLGDITNARGTEATLLIWTRIYAATQNGAFNMKLVK